jgi:hypothetical protein
VDRETLRPLYDALHRYAGWLNRERPSVTVRADVQALGIAIDTRADLTPLLHTLDADLARLPSGDLRKMLRAASQKLRSAVAEHP